MKLKNLKSFSLFKKHIHEFFTKNNFLEIQTPFLVLSPGLEPFLDPFETELKVGSQSKKLYLPTSPEFHLKKALCIGYKNIYEIKTCFRNGEISEHHQPEFLMLEWYRTKADNKALIKDIQNLLTYLSKKTKKPAQKLQVIKMEDLWKKHLNFILTPKTTLEDLKDLYPSDENNFDDLFTRIWIEKLEPEIAKLKYPIIIYHYPPSQAALAKLTKEGWADRFELYWKGLEIANAFNELTDPVEQRKRFLKDQEKKRQLGKSVVPIDEEFMKALEKGMPQSAGIALGVERLFMAFYNVKDISEMRLFPVSQISMLKSETIRNFEK